ncbi:LPD28 domain-containing protein, partial [Qingrenia yutianensis]
CERLNRNLPIEGVNYYDIRHDDECRGDMAQLKDRVMVNHWGTVISKERFEPREVGDKISTTAEGIDMDESDYNYLGETLSVSEYLEKYDELVREYCEPKEENNLEMGM